MFFIMSGVCGCVKDATVGSTYLTANQVESSPEAQMALLRGVASHMTSCNNHGANCDGGYPGIMYLRECYGEDFPVSNDAYSYYFHDENGNNVTYRGYYVMSFYYSLINNCNNVIGNINAETAPASSLNNLGIALAYRSLAYLDLARFMEYQPTGYESIDNEAKTQWGCMKLTASIVTPNMSAEQLKNNPRVPYYTMYRFILKDLNDAEKYLLNYTPTSTVYPNIHVVYGMKARFWLELASRFESMPEDLSEQLKHENDGDGYAQLSVSSATDCYQKAAEYSQKAMAGYSPMTQEQYQNPTTGFNTAADNSWMWIMRNSSKDEVQDLYYYYSFLGQMVSEATWAMAQYGGLFRCITNRLYSLMDENDWRRYCWVSEDAAGAEKVPAGYRSNMTNEQWKTLPAYANLKFRSRSMTDNYSLG
ncbi:MAG: RagB/SusD family nutrient uptake outer membrane protein, partial [Bacteroidaceae bacterium]|nr:RagB/SusD family nutrient uptake outer membrane protein [Bacteroidaceae bacterium]